MWQYDTKVIGNGKLVKRGLWLPWVAMFCIFLATHALNAEELFPVPKSLETNVDFWTKIFAQYSSNHVVIHDRDDLSVIYDVVNLNEFYPDSVDMRTKWDAVDEIKDRYRDILRELAALPHPIAVDSLTNDQFHVYVLWSTHENPDKFSRAVYNIRGQLGLRDRFAESIKRSGYYFRDIQTIFRSHGLPIELCYLPHVESLFHYNIYSKVGAAGLWQFIYRTGRLYMTIDAAVDERLDPLYASEAAARFLKGNYEELGSWPMAITAYNHGLNGMKTAKQRLGTTDFDIIVREYKSRSFGFASKNFYAEFLAAIHVAQNYNAYFGALQPYQPKSYQLVELPESYYLRQLAEKFDVPSDTLIAYNPAFRRAAQQNWRRIPSGYRLRLPYREGYDPREVFVQATAPARYQKYQPPVQPPDLLTLASTASADSVASQEDMTKPQHERGLSQPANRGESDVFESPPASMQTN